MCKKLIYVLVICISAFSYAQDDEIKLSLDKLFNLKVTSVSGTAMDMKKSPAAIYVITPEDFKEQGHRTIADALRAVPGFHVRQIDSSKFAISARGFSDRFADKLLVLIDGRSVYTPLFSGVYWEIQDLPLEDIDRIEVIRGPGATLWGANAVNGVINIVTKSVRDTEGGYVKFGLGTNVDYETEFRYGWQATDNFFAKVWGKKFARGESESSLGLDDNDSWDGGHWGGKFDWYPTAVDTHSFQTNFTKLNVGSTVNAFESSGFGFVPLGGGASTAVAGAHLLGAPEIFNRVARSADDNWEAANFMWTWNKSLSASSGWAFKTYYDYTNYESILFDERRQTVDVDFRNWFNLNSSNSFIWGLSFKTTEDRIKGSTTVTLDPLKRRTNTFSGFLQNTTQLTDKLSIMYGTKLEYNDISRVEIQPSVRLTYELTEDTVVWASWSRAVKRPSRADDDVNLKLALNQGGLSTDVRGITGFTAPAGLPADSHIPLVISGNRDFDSEELIAYELGLRTNFWNKKLTLDAAVFYNDYQNIRNFALITESPPTAKIANTDSAETYGAEISLKLKATDDLDIMLNYTWFKANDHGDFSDEQTDAQNLLFTQVNYKLFKNLSWHTSVFYSDSIKNDELHSFVNLNTGLIWTIDKHWEMSIWGKNLLDPQHPEAPGGFFASGINQIPRSFFIECTYRF